MVHKIKEVSSYSDVSGTDIYEESQRLSQEKTDYQRAFNALDGVTYLNKLKPIFNRTKLFKAFYHILSPVLGVATAYLLGEQFLGLSISSPILVLLIALVIGLVLVFIFFWLEDFKKHFLTEIYKSISNEKKPDKNAVTWLRFIIFGSIVISAVGGACISYKMADNTQTIVKDFKTEKDSLGKYYVNEITILRNQIKTIEDIRKSPARLPWGGGLTPDETASLQVYQKRLAKLENERNAQIGTLKKEHSVNITANTSNVWKSVGVSVAIVVLFELLLVYCYKFEYVDYYKKVRHEAINYGIVGVNSLNTHSKYVIEDTLEGVNTVNNKKYIEKIDENIKKNVDLQPSLNTNPIGFTQIKNFDNNSFDVNNSIVFKEVSEKLPTKQRTIIPYLKEYYSKLNSKEKITLEDVAELSGASLSTVHNVKRILQQNMKVNTTVA